MFKNNKQILSKTDSEQLPVTRKQLFFDVLKNDFFLLADLNLLQFLFSIPLIAVLFAFYHLFTSLSEVSSQNVFSLTFYMGLAIILCMMVRYMGRGASFAVMKKRAFNEGCFVSSEFVKNFIDFKKPLLVGLINGLSLELCLLGSVYFLYSADNSIAQGLGIGICILQYCIVEGASQHALASNCYYSLPFFALLKNGFSLALSNVFVTIGYFAVCVALPCFLITLSLLSAILTAFVYFLTIDALTVLFSTLYSHSLFDKYINKENYPELVGKGLNNKKDV